MRPTSSGHQRIFFLFFFLSVLCGSYAAAQGKSEPAQFTRNRLQIRKAAAAAAYTFQPNVGQQDASSLFVATGPDSSLSLKRDGFEITTYRRVSAPRTMLRPVALTGGATQASASPGELLTTETASVTFEGANPNVQVTGVDPERAKANYLVGNDPSKWHSNVPTFARVRYANLYPGVDLVFYGGRERHLEYDLVVAPGADPSQIRFHVASSSGAALDRDGNLLLDGAGSVMRILHPVLYQDGVSGKQPVSGGFVQRSSGEFGFRLAPYDKSHALIIDPKINLLYSTYAGGIHDDQAFDMTLDGSGNTYITGEAASQDFPVTGNAYQQTRMNIGSYVYDAIVMKFDASGDLLFSTFLGGSQSCSGEGVRVDASGVVFVAGSTGSADFPVTANAYQRTWGGGSDAFFAVLSNDGSQLIYSTYLGGPGDENIFRMIQDPAGNLWVAGEASAAGLPATAGAYQSKPNGSDDGFVAELTYTAANQQPLSIPALTFLGGSTSSEEGGLYDVSLDSTGNVYVGGITSDTDFPTTTNAYQRASAFKLSGGCYNSAQPNSIGTIAEFSADLKTLIYSTVLGGKTEDQNGYPVCNQFIHTVHPDGKGNIWAVGISGMSDFPTTSNALSTQLNGNGSAGADIVVSELTPAAQATILAYSTYLGGSQLDYGPRAVWDANNNIWIIATSQSTDWPGIVQGTSLQPSNGGGYDATITELQPDGTAILYATYFGGNGDEDASNGRATLALDPNGNLYLAGGTGSGNFPLTANAFQTVIANGDSGYDGYDVYYTVLGSGIVGSATPSTIGSTGDATVTISGAGFEAGATCSIVLNGTTINAVSSVVSASGTSITCTFALNGATAGAYNIVITNPSGGGTFTRSGGLTVASGGAPQVWSNIVGRPIIRTGVPSTIIVNYGNSGTVDGYMSHLSVNFPASVQASYTVSVPPTISSGVQVPTSFNSNGQTTIDLLLPRLPAGSSGSFPIALTDPVNNDKFNIGASITEPWFTTAADATAALTSAASSFTPGSTTCTSPTHTVTNCLNAYLSGLSNSGATNAQVEAVASTILTTLQQADTYNYAPQMFGTNLTTAPSGLIAGTLVVLGVPSYDTQLTYTVQGVSSSNLININQSNCVSYAANVNDSLGGTLMKCTIPNVMAPLGTNATIAGGSLSLGINSSLIPTLDGCFTVIQPNARAGFTATVTENTATCNLNGESGEDPDKAPTVPDGTIITIGGDEEIPPQTIIDIPFVDVDPYEPETSGGSIDPNGKSGSMGDGSASHFVRGSVPLPYLVYFENEAKASLPAANVVITDQLDPTKVDLSTLTLGSITFGTNVISVPSNLSSYSTNYAVNSSLEVRVQGSLDKTSGLLKWTFTSIDPSTGLPPTDPSVGFLPPDVDGIVGQGSVSYNVMPLAEQTTGTAISNFASVVFDANAPIVTPTFLNTLDVDPPVSSVTALPASEPATGTTGSFKVSWSGTDKGSGIASYNIYVSDNGGAFTEWQSSVTATSATYTGQLNHTYGFYSIATDGAGNMETAKTTPDTTTIVGGVASTTTLTASPTTAYAGQSVTLTATVAGPTGTTNVPTGAITFANGATSLGTVNLNASGAAILATTTLAIGSDAITASYAGDTNFGPSTSAPVTVTISAAPPSFTVAANPPALTIVAGQTGTATLTVTPTGGFNQAVTFACSGLPASSQCSFSPATITPSGSAASTTLSISTDVKTSALTEPASPWRSSPAGVYACLLLGGFGTLLRLRALRRTGKLRSFRATFLVASALLLLSALGLGSLTACGNSGAVYRTPPGTSTVTVTAASGSIGQTATITITVQ